MGEGEGERVGEGLRGELKKQMRFLLLTFIELDHLPSYLLKNII